MQNTPNTPMNTKVEQTVLKQALWSKTKLPSQNILEQITDIYSKSYNKYLLTETEQVKQFLETGGQIITVETDGKIVAVAKIEINEAKSTINITGLAVLPDYRGHKLGTRLNQMILKLAKTKSISSVISDPVLNSNQRAEVGVDGKILNTEWLAGNFVITFNPKKLKFIFSGLLLGFFPDNQNGVLPTQEISVAMGVKFLNNGKNIGNKSKLSFLKHKLELIEYLQDKKEKQATEKIECDFDFEKVINITNSENLKVEYADEGRIVCIAIDSLKDLPTGFVPCAVTQDGFMAVWYQKINCKNENNPFDLSLEVMQKHLSPLDFELMLLTESVLKTEFKDKITLSK
jgi:GNAT superfamily N-acetyltransferase